MTCPDPLEALLAAATANERDEALAVHLRACSECAEVARRFELREQALGQLARLEAPADLAGRVVAALNAGYREERGIARLGELERVTAPSQLEALVARTFDRVPAPPVLERLVREDLESDGQGLLKRFTNKLGRQAAPEDLDERMHDVLVHRSRRRVPRVALAAAALLAFVVWLPTTQQPARAAGYSFKVVRVMSLDEATTDRATRQLVEGLLPGTWGGSAR